jgi:transcriptional regulator with XRE-family HTH domain
MERTTKPERALALLQGARLREARHRAGLTLAEVSADAGVAVTTLAAYERGTIVLRPYMATVLAPLVGRTPAHLLCVEEPVRVTPAPGAPLESLVDAARLLGFDFSAQVREGTPQYFLQPQHGAARA